jgi:3-oxocholest-4-en-26-oyl-CoA dehydrogenase beta subunit
MDFDFSESQQILINSARGFLEKQAKDLARKMEKTEEGFSLPVWNTMADLGWMGSVFPEDFGGTNGNFLDLILLLREMGRALVPGPFIPTMLSGLAILQYGQESQKEKFLPSLIEGKTIIVPAFSKPDSRSLIPSGEEQTRVGEKGYAVSGTRIFVPYPKAANWYLYQADSELGTSLFLVDCRSQGIKWNLFPTIAGDKQGVVVFDKVPVLTENILVSGEKGDEALRQIGDWGALFQCAYILGMLEKVLEMTTEHAKQREQFGKYIGSFQAIQHQCADMATEIDKVKFLTYQAAWNLSEGMPAAKEISMAKAKASDASRNVCMLGIKIHGGIGISEEHDMQLFFRRAKAAELSFGDGDYHRERIAQQIGL